MQTIREAILAAFCFVSAGHANAQTGDRSENVCPSLNNAVSSDLLQFLSGVTPDKGNSRCVTWAIRKLGLERYEPAVVVLVKLLDFRRSPTDEEARGIYLRPQSTDEIFPAVLALELIGKPALPDVLRAIELDSASATARNNALSVWMEVHKYERPKGIALLKQEESTANQDNIKRQLRWAAEKARKYCGKQEESACREASISGKAPEE